MLLRDEIALPPGLVGPLESLELAWLAANWAGEGDVGSGSLWMGDAASVVSEEISVSLSQQPRDSVTGLTDVWSGMAADCGT